MTASESTINKLLSEAKAGRAEKTGTLLQLYRNYLTLLAATQVSGRLRKRMSPSDVVQEAMLAAHRDIGAFRGASEREFMAWLRQVLLNTIHHAVEKHVKAQRRDVRREVSFEQVSQGLDHSAAVFVHGFADAGPTPSEPMRRRELALAVADRLAKLQPQYRDVIVLRNLQDLSFEEIAERMNRSKGAVRMLWLRAIAKLKDLYAEETAVVEGE